MAKTSNSAKNQANALKRRCEGYADIVRRQFSAAANDLLDLARSASSIPSDQLFSFGKTKRMRDEADLIIRTLHAAVYEATKRGIILEWEEANKAIDAYLGTMIGRDATKNPNLAGWFARNNAARDAFIARAEGGMNLSRRVWQYSKQLRDEMELAISVAAAEGKSAADLSRDVRKYLAEPDRLFRRVRQYYYDENGDKKFKLVLSKAAQAYHPGRGVYRSSYKNAMRMARTETNMAYRSADFERWQALEFIKGFHIGLSKAHPHADICDMLAGDYPKEFKFTGWHPQCFCVVTPITSSDEDFAKQIRAKLAGDPMPATTGKITAMPAAFNEWIKDHEEQIKAAPSLPYWIRDNFIDGDIKKGLRFQQEPTLLQLAEARHAARTPEQIKAIKDRWEERKKANEAAARVPFDQLPADQRVEWIDFITLNYPISAPMKEALNRYGIDFSDYESHMREAYTKREYWRKDELRAEHNALMSRLNAAISAARDKAIEQIKKFEREAYAMGAEKWVGGSLIRNYVSRGMSSIAFADSLSRNFSKDYNSIIQSFSAGGKLSIEKFKTDVQLAKLRYEVAINNAKETIAEYSKQTDVSKLTALVNETLTATRSANIITLDIDVEIKNVQRAALGMQAVADNAKSFGVERVEIKKHKKQPTEQDMINTIGGGDKTSGSCSSLALAWSANRGGLNVLDFRGGKSTDFFSRNGNIKDFVQAGGGIYEYASGLELMKKTEIGKEYYFAAGAHAAIIRQVSKGKWEYLELQSGREGYNGWRELNNKILGWRFSSRGRGYNFLISVENLNKTKGFKEMMEYINTAAADQKKGASGSIK